MGGEEGVSPAQDRLAQTANILASLCRCQPSGIFQEFLQEGGDFDLGDKGFYFLLGEGGKLLFLSSEHFYLHGHPVYLNWG